MTRTFTCFADRRLLRAAAREIAQLADDLLDAHCVGGGNLKTCPWDIQDEIRRLRDLAKDLRAAAREGAE